MKILTFIFLAERGVLVFHSLLLLGQVVVPVLGCHGSIGIGSLPPFLLLGRARILLPPFLDSPRSDSTCGEQGGFLSRLNSCHCSCFVSNWQVRKFSPTLKWCLLSQQSQGKIFLMGIGDFGPFWGELGFFLLVYTEHSIHSQIIKYSWWEQLESERNFYALG